MPLKQSTQKDLSFFSFAGTSIFLSSAGRQGACVGQGDAYTNVCSAFQSALIRSDHCSPLSLE